MRYKQQIEFALENNLPFKTDVLEKDLSEFCSLFFNFKAGSLFYYFDGVKIKALEAKDYFDLKVPYISEIKWQYQKRDLKTGMRVTLRCGVEATVYLGCTAGDIIADNNGFLRNLAEYSEELKNKNGALDIVRIMDTDEMNSIGQYILYREIWRI